MQTDLDSIASDYSVNTFAINRELFGVLCCFRVYISSLPVVHPSDATRIRSVVMRDSVRIQEETTESSAWFFDEFGV